MSALFEELDYRKTPMGELILQRRQLLALKGVTVYEVKLGNEYLMSSLFHASEVALADIVLGELTGGSWEVVVGGLGLGYTAAAALKFDQLERLIVVEALEPVIDWHKRGLVPNGEILNQDQRCDYLHADFFELVRAAGFDPESPGRRFDAILLDIDHTPDFLLDPGHAEFYTTAGLARLKSFLKPDGIFGLWSNDPPQDAFTQKLSGVFSQAEGRTIAFENPLQQSVSSNGIYICRC